jgi:hypothetical protein
VVYDSPSANQVSIREVEAYVTSVVEMSVEVLAATVKGIV